MAEEYISHLHRQLADTSFDHPDRAFLEKQLQAGYDYLRSGRRDKLTPSPVVGVEMLQQDDHKAPVLTPGTYDLGDIAKIFHISFRTLDRMLEQSPEVPVLRDEDDRRRKLLTDDQIVYLGKKFGKAVLLDIDEPASKKEKRAQLLKRMQRSSYEDKQFSLEEAARELGISPKTLHTRMAEKNVLGRVLERDRRVKTLTGAQLKELIS